MVKRVIVVCMTIMLLFAQANLMTDFTLEAKPGVSPGDKPGKGSDCNAGGSDDADGCDPGNSGGKNCGGDEGAPDKCKKGTSGSDTGTDTGNDTNTGSNQDSNQNSGSDETDQEGSDDSGSQGKHGSQQGSSSASTSDPESPNAQAGQSEPLGVSKLVQGIQYGYIYPAFVEPNLIAPGDLIQVHFETMVANLSSFFQLNCNELLGQEIFTVGEYFGEIVGCGPSMLVIETSTDLSEGEVQVSIDELERISFSLTICTACRNAFSFAEAEEALTLGRAPNEILVFMSDPSFLPGELKETLTAYGYENANVQIHKTIPGYAKIFLHGYSLEEIQRLSELLSTDVHFSGVISDYLITPSQITDPDFGQQFHLSHLNLPSGWDQVFTKKGAGIVLGVVDSGIDFDNSPEEFIYPGCAPLGYDMSTAYPEEGAPTSSLAGNDDIGHGTAVAAIAAAANNDVQGVGVAPEVLLVSLKVFSLIGESQEIKGTLDDVSRSLQMAYQLGVHVINMSLGCQGCDATTEEKNLEFYDALLKSLEAGHNPGLIFNSDCTLNFEQRNSSPIIVASSGNDGDSQLDAPAVLPGIISVGSVSLTAGDDGNRSRFSNYGPGLDFLAEGENLITTNLGGDFGSAEVSGTSFSAPQVAGLVAMILAENPSLSTQDVRELIARCFVHDLGAAGWDMETGYGRIYIADEDALAPNCMPQAWSN